MIAANRAVQRPSGAKLMSVSGDGNIGHLPRRDFENLLRAGDLVIANDAATLPASLQGSHIPSGRNIEIRLAGLSTLRLEENRSFSAVVFGEGDFRARTEDRPAPPPLAPGDRLALGPLRARVTRLLSHPRFVAIEFEGAPNDIWEGLARHGRPIQYSHLPKPLELWDIWTPIAGPPVAFEPPSAGFILSWRSLESMKARGIRFASITHAAGISSTGDEELDGRLPFDEPYRIPPSTALAIKETRARGGRIIAVGTSVVRALEHAATADGIVRGGEGMATQRVGPSTRLRIVDAILSGTHERGTSHYELLRAFADEETLGRMERELNSADYRTHEFGDSIFLQRAA